MRRHLLSCMLAAALSGILLISMVACNNAPDKPQTDATGKKHDRPRMWVDDSTGQADEKNFAPFDAILSSQIHQPEPDSFYYSVQAFRGLIEACGTMPKIAYLDIFPIVPIATGKLSILFVAKDAKYHVLANFQLPDQATTFDRVGDSVDPYDATMGEANYGKTVVQWLNPMLDTTDCYNYADCDSLNLVSFGNTAHISHYYLDFAELDTEIKYQLTDYNNKITGIKAFFAAHAKQPRGTIKGYSNRIYVLLEFTVDDPSDMSRHPILHIDTTNRLYVGPDFPGKDPCKYANPKSENNGQLCPPTCIP